MDAGSLFGQGISFPPRLGANGQFAWSSGPDNIREAIQEWLEAEADEAKLFKVSEAEVMV